MCMHQKKKCQNKYRLQKSFALREKKKRKKKSNILPEAALEYVTRQFISDYRERVGG